MSGEMLTFLEKYFLGRLTLSFFFFIYSYWVFSTKSNLVTQIRTTPLDKILSKLSSGIIRERNYVPIFFSWKG